MFHTNQYLISLRLTIQTLENNTMVSTVADISMMKLMG